MEEGLRPLKLADAVTYANELGLRLEVAHKTWVSLFLAVPHGLNPEGNACQKVPRLRV